MLVMGERERGGGKLVKEHYTKKPAGKCEAKMKSCHFGKVLLIRFLYSAILGHLDLSHTIGLQSPCQDPPCLGVRLQLDNDHGRE